MIRPLLPNEAIPYTLLLLADETQEAIDKYAITGNIYVYEIQKEIIGALVLYTLSQDEIEIKNIAVKENHQGKGIGTFLIRNAIERATKNNFKNIYIGTSNAAFRQLSLYQKEGFEIHEIKKNFFIDNYPELIYENGILLNHMIMLVKKIGS